MSMQKLDQAEARIIKALREVNSGADPETIVGLMVRALTGCPDGGMSQEYLLFYGKDAP